MSATNLLDFVENHVDPLFNEVYRLRALPEDYLRTDDRRVLELADRYIEFARIQEPTLEDRIACNQDLSNIVMS